MEYFQFVVAGLAATSLGYVFGWALERWEKRDPAQEDFNALPILLALVGTVLLSISGFVFMIVNLWLLSLVASLVLVVVGFRFGHPNSAVRMRQITRTVEEIVLTLKK